MTILVWSLYVISAALLTHIYAVSGTGDPVADACSPLCNEESSLEVQCARARGCYNPSIKNNSTLYSECWTHCWHLAGQCFDLCADNFDTILHQCYDVCRSNTGLGLNCIATCFSTRFTTLKVKHMNLTLEENILPNSGKNITSDKITDQPILPQKDSQPTILTPPTMPPSTTLSPDNGIILQNTANILASILEHIDASRLEFTAEPTEVSEIPEQSSTFQEQSETTEEPELDTLTAMNTNDPEIDQLSILDDGHEKSGVSSIFRQNKIDLSRLRYKDLRELFLRYNGEFRKKLDYQWDKDAWGRILAMYTPATDTQMDQYGIEHLGTPKSGDQSVGKLIPILKGSVDIVESDHLK